MALVIGKRASNVSAEDAFDYIFGYVNFIDGSARGLPPAGNTFYQMKSRETFAPMGPWLVTADEIADPQNLQVRLWVNEELKQNFNTNDMAHQIPRVIEWVSSIHPLEPGDVVATGTNHRGLSSFMDGDLVDLECEGLGTLRFNVRDDLKRTWLRETRLDRQEKGLDGNHSPDFWEIRLTWTTPYRRVRAMAENPYLSFEQVRAAMNAMTEKALELPMSRWQWPSWTTPATWWLTPRWTTCGCSAAATPSARLIPRP